MSLTFKKKNSIEFITGKGEVPFIIIKKWDEGFFLQE